MQLPDALKEGIRQSPSGNQRALRAAGGPPQNAKASLTDFAYEVLLDKILFLDLPPHTLVDLRSVAKEIQTSVTPLNAALRRLEKIRLVRILPRKGILITPVDFKELHSVFELRLVLSSFVGRVAAQRIALPTLRELEDILALMEALVQQPESRDQDREFFRLEKRSHDILDEATGNEILKEANELCYYQSFRLWLIFKEQLAPKVRMYQEWMEIYWALQARDAQLAEQCCRKHVLNSIETVKMLFSVVTEL
jgi:GntR family transcriptional regulator, rspAB operon transcriptional repressor